MVLEKEVVLVSNTTNPTKDGALHKVVCIAAEAVDNVMIVPDVQLRDLRVRRLEGLLAVPTGIVVEVVLIAFGTHFLIERKITSLYGIVNVCPRLRYQTSAMSSKRASQIEKETYLERSIDTHAIIVDLVPTSNHDMKRALFVHA